MILRKIFDPRELDLTEEEERYLCEECGGSSDSCFKTFEVLYPEDAVDRYGYEEILVSVNQKLFDTGLVEIGESVMIDLCW